MKGRLTVALLALVMAAPVHAEGDPKELSFARQARPSFRLQAAVECPQNNSAWENWRDAATRRLLKPSAQRPDVVSIGDLVQTSDNIDQFLTACRQDANFANSDRATSIIGNLGRFTKALARNNYMDHRFGFTITDTEYLAQSKAQLELPALLKSQDFLRSVSEKDGLARAKKMIDDLNATLTDDKKWTVLLYKSRFLATPDCYATFGRFFIHVPENGFDKWIQFGMPTPDYQPQPASEDCNPVPKRANNLSIASVAPRDANGKSKTLTLDYWRTYNADGSVNLGTRYETVNATENCFMCHKTAPLGLHPQIEYNLSATGELTPNTVNPGMVPKKLNAKILNDYGTLSFGDWQDTGDFGPTIGPASRPRDITFLRSCARNPALTDTNLENVRKSMKCDSCHDDTGLGPLNVPQSLKTPTSSTSGQLREYIMQGWMPPNNQLTTPERDALHACLLQEYLDVATSGGLLTDWLKQSN